MNIPELFGIDVFNDKEMKKRLSKEIYESLYNTIEQHKELDIKIANEVAAAMKEWAIEHGATHYTHWFQPLTVLRLRSTTPLFPCRMRRERLLWSFLPRS